MKVFGLQVRNTKENEGERKTGIKMGQFREPGRMGEKSG